MDRTELPCDPQLASCPRLQPQQAAQGCNPMAPLPLLSWFCRYHDQYNAVHCANSPTLDGLKAQAPRRWRTLRAHGTAVGLPSDADMGNSEVGAGSRAFAGQPYLMIHNVAAWGCRRPALRCRHGQLQGGCWRAGEGRVHICQQAVDAVWRLSYPCAWNCGGPALGC